MRTALYHGFLVSKELWCCVGVRVKQKINWVLLNDLIKVELSTNVKDLESWRFQR